ncbi:MAG: efflux RND transporter periplasmic adaptor subunit [Fuerstiella sp.]|nr:efflux RND transporter periplasmic adaptor subunit [Fuerstiella sp.]
MKYRTSRDFSLVILIAVVVLGFCAARRWIPLLQNLTWAPTKNSVGALKQNRIDHTDGHAHHLTGAHGDNNHNHGHHERDHSGDSHEHDHSDRRSHAGRPTDGSYGNHQSNALELSAKARKNLGLLSEQIQTVELNTFWRTISVPGKVVGRPGRTDVQVATPMTGLITHVHTTQGEAVRPGTLLFRIRLTHEDLLQLQTEFLQTVGELDVAEHEIERLEKVTRSQAIPGRVLLEREYERDKLTSLRNAQRESLRLHGLSDKQIQSIVTDRRLIRELELFAPTADSHLADSHQHQEAEEDHASTEANELLVLERLNVHKGQVIPAGTTLCVLKDYSELLIEGLALEQDIPTLRRALRQEYDVTAVFEQPGGVMKTVGKLRIEYLKNEVDPESRSIRFFVRLSNRMTGKNPRGDVSFVEWAWLIGQRVQLRIPFGRWKNQLVLPAQAVAEQGVENYVFRKHGEHFDRVAIRVKYRDPLFVVVERDGAISPGNQIAWKGAHQMQMAIRRQSDEPVNAYHGHTH